MAIAQKVFAGGFSKKARHESRHSPRAFGASLSDPSITLEDFSDTTVVGRISEPKIKDRGGLEKPIHDAEGGDSEDEESLNVEERKRCALRRKIPIGLQIRYILFGSWVNLLLPFVPIGFALNYTKTSSIAVFCTNFLAIVPSATLLSTATDEISMRYGDKVGALLNIPFG